MDYELSPVRGLIGFENVTFLLILRLKFGQLLLVNEWNFPKWFYLGIPSEHKLLRFLGHMEHPHMSGSQPSGCCNPLIWFPMLW